MIEREITADAVADMAALLNGAEWEVVNGRGYQTVDVSDKLPDFKRAFFVKLPPGTSMHKHVDCGDCQTDHVVITTNPQCLNYWGNDPIHMEVGKRYTVDRTIEHWAVNDGDTDRIHLLLEY